MKVHCLFLLFVPLRLCFGSLALPLAGPDLVFEERDGFVAVEAEHFVKQTATETRAWYRTSLSERFATEADADPVHVAGAGGGAYLEILPDTRHNHSHKLIRGQNFSPEPGRLGVLHYRVHFNNPGRYHVWVRAYSTGSEDNGLHVGLNGAWPESGQRMQWCAGKQSWWWESRQRTEQEHCGVPQAIFLDIPKPGVHEIQFSMREDGFEFDRFILTQDRDFPRPANVGPPTRVKTGTLPAAYQLAAAKISPSAARARPRRPDGDGSVTISGELKQWHKVTLTADWRYAHEQDENPNPFTDYRLTAVFSHADGKTRYTVPGHFAADGDAANSSAPDGTHWRVHFAPDKPGRWQCELSIVAGRQVAINDVAARQGPRLFHKTLSFDIAPTDKTGRDLRALGRLQYVGRRYLRFAGTGDYFLKAGADAPETFLGYADFDNTIARKPKKVPLKTWGAHFRDWRPGDPTWRDGKGKGMIGAINYLAAKGCNVFSFMPYNAGGDGDNVWPFVERDDKFHYDCSKLDQWGIVFDHATTLGHYLHFKLQETEMDDNRTGHNARKGSGGSVPTSLDGGKLGPERRLYCREIISRFGHALALNWNLGEENTQSTAEQIDMAQYIHDVDPYDHLIVVHTFPDQQDKVYPPLFGEKSQLSGFSLQNSGIRDTHWQVVKWVNASAAAGKPWIVAFDESGTAAWAQVPDLGYEGFDGHDNSGKQIHTQHEVRKYTLWGTLMGGGAGCEYYFGYKCVQNDLVCEDWRSRDQSWDYCRIALQFFREQQIPFWDMLNADSLVGADPRSNERYCFAKPGEIYLVYLTDGGTSRLDLTGVPGDFEVRWFNPRTGGDLSTGSVAKVRGGGKVTLGDPPGDRDQDWLAIIR